MTIAPLNIKREKNDDDDDAVTSPSDFITIKVAGFDTKELHFRAKVGAEMWKIKQMYCDRVGIESNSMVFSFDNNYVKDRDSPASLQMEDGDYLQVNPISWKG